MITTNNYFLELAFHIATNQFLFKRTSKITFFRGFLMIALWDTAASDGFFFQKICISNFRYSQLCASCDIWFKSSWGVDFEYIKFYWWKTFEFYIKSLIIFGTVPKIYLNSLSHEYYQKLFVGISIWYMYQSIPF